MIKGLIIVAIVIYSTALVGYFAAWIAETVIDDKAKKAKAEKFKFYFLFIVCLPYWLYKKIKNK